MLQSPERHDRFRKRKPQSVVAEHIGSLPGKSTRRNAALAATAAILGLVIPMSSANSVGIATNPVVPNATIIVNSLLDPDVCDATTCTLRGAVTQANTAAGDDIIQIDALGTITIASAISVAGGANNGLTVKTDAVNTVTLAAASTNVILDVPTGANLTLTNLSIGAPTASGGNVSGVTGIGGNATAYIINNTGTLTLNTPTISAPTANGGNVSPGIGGDATAYVVNNTGTLNLNTPTISAPTANGGNVSGVSGIGGKAIAYVVKNTGTLNLNTPTISAPTANGGNVSGDSGVGGNATAYIIDNTGALNLNTPTVSAPTANGGNVSGATGIGGKATAYVVNNTGTLSLSTPTISAPNARAGTSRHGGFGGGAAASNVNNIGNGVVVLLGTNGIRTKPANAAGWNNTDFDLNWSWDGLGIITITPNSCPSSTTVSTEVDGTTIEQSCVGTGGTIKSSATIKLDKTAPVVTITGVANSAIYEPDAVPAPGCSTTDALSGVAQNASAQTTGTGPYTVTCSGALDKAGNTGTSTSVSYRVKTAQSITFDQPGSKEFGTTATLIATASSELPVSFTSTTPTMCTVTETGLLSALTVGTCEIQTEQAGNTTIVAAPRVARSFPINPVLPGAPTNITATPGDTKATITFTAPVATGGAAITNYRVTATPTGQEPTTTSSNVHGIFAQGETSPITVIGLTNGTAYTFTVKACTTAGCTQSGPSNDITPKAPQTIEFTVPESINFGTTAALVATASTGLVPTFTTSTRTVCEVTPAGALTTLTTGDCTITAAQAGNSATLPATAVTRTTNIKPVAPGAPTGITPTAGNTQVAVSFTPPTQTGGAPIAGYTITALPGGATFLGATSPIVAAGLTNDVAYTFTVTAANGTLTSVPSAPSAPVTPTDPNRSVPVVTAAVAVTPQPVAAQPVAPPLVFLPLGVTPTAPAEATATVEPQTAPASTETATPAPATAATPTPVAPATANPEASVLSVEPSGTNTSIAFEATGYLYVDATVHSTPFNAGRFYPDPDGVIRGQIILPAGFEAGDHRLELVGPTPTGETKTKNTYFTVRGITLQQTEQTSDLALTGTDSKNLTVMASLILIAGVLLVRRGRRETI